MDVDASHMDMRALSLSTYINLQFQDMHPGMTDKAKVAGDDMTT